MTTMQADYYLLRQARFDLGLSQKDAAKAAGVSLRTYINAERGRDIHPSTNGKIKRALGLL